MTDESKERVISYATPMREPYDVTFIGARDLFGVVVRTAGLVVTFWGVYTLIYLLSAVAADAPLDGETPLSLFLFAIFLFGSGVALLRGEWVVQYAYRPPRVD